MVKPGVAKRIRLVSLNFTMGWENHKDQHKERQQINLKKYQHKKEKQGDKED